MTSPVSQILESRQPRAKNRLQLLAIVARHREFVLHVLLDLQLRHALLRLLLTGNLNVEMFEMPGQVRIEPGVVANVAVDVPATFWRDRAQLDPNTVPSSLKVAECMTVAICAAMLLATAIDAPAGQAQPQVGGQVAL